MTRASGLVWYSNVHGRRPLRLTISVIEGLRDRDTTVTAYDSVAVENMNERSPEIDYADTAVDTAVIITSWHEFASPDEEFDAVAGTNPVDVRGPA